MTHDHDWCETCHGPVIPRSRLSLWFAAVCFRLFMAMPERLALGWLGFKLLPWVGQHAYSCSCERARA